MAEGIRFACGSCEKTIEAWSDGNPYYIDGAGEKQYAYHPDHENLAKCIGNDSPHLCLGCGAESMVDSRAPIKACPKCDSEEIVDTFALEDKRCPYCKNGVFTRDPNFMCVS
jgi:predicted Zn-ribbon and HTH transcriptional regulator